MKVPANEIANSYSNPRGINIVMLGAAVKASGLFEQETFVAAIDEFFARKGKTNPKNALCCREGAACVK